MNESRRVLAIAAVIAVFVLLTRLPFVTHSLWAWDSVLYARALEQGFHVDHVFAEQRPHPPGYLFYVGLAALFRSALGDANAALVAVSLLGTLLAVVAVFLLGRRFGGTRAGTIAALAFALNPVVWLYGEVAYPYTLLAFLVAALALVFHTARDRSPLWRLAATALFGLSAGFRQDVLLILLPLWIWMLWAVPWRERGMHLAALGAACLVWFVPSALLSGGFERYVNSVRLAADGVGSSSAADATSGLAALSYNVRMTLVALTWGTLGIGAFLLAVGLLRFTRWWKARSFAIGSRAIFFSLWLGPAVLFYALVHIGEWGYALSVLPGFYVLAAAQLGNGLARVLSGRTWARPALAALVAGPATIFLFSQDIIFASAAIEYREEAMAAKVAYVRAAFPPESTVILARGDFLHVRYYLPEYKTWYHDPRPYKRQVATRKRCRQATTVVLFAPDLWPMRPQDVRLAEVSPGVSLRYYLVEPGSSVQLRGERVAIMEPRAR
jgi:4-amino-4-deoxy-L-arabinose transferase-like glycosyltransferase